MPFQIESKMLNFFPIPCILSALQIHRKLACHKRGTSFLEPFLILKHLSYFLPYTRFVCLECNVCKEAFKHPIYLLKYVAQQRRHCMGLYSSVKLLISLEESKQFWVVIHPETREHPHMPDQVGLYHKSPLALCPQ